MKKQHRALYWVFVITMFMEMLDISVINTSLPQMASSLGVGPLQLKVALTSYLLSLGIFVPTSGWIADRYGTRTAFLGALITFTVGSILSSLAFNLEILIVARVIQGAGGALMAPLVRLIMYRVFSRSEVVRIGSHVAMVSMIGPIMGPLVGGFLTTYCSWRLIFWVNVPIGLLGFFAVRRFVPQVKGAVLHAFDWQGFFLVGSSSGLLLLGCQSVMSESLLTLAWSSILLSFFLLGVYFFHARHTPHPVISPKIFRQRVYRLGVAGSLVSRIGISCMPFLIPLLFQLGHGLNALQSGALVCSVTIGAIGMKFFVKPILKHCGFRTTLLVNSGCLALSTWSLALLAFPLVWWEQVGILLIYGFFTSLQFSASTLLIFSEVRRHLTSQSNSAFSAIQQIVASVSIAIGAVLLEFFSGSHDLEHSIPLEPFRKVFFILAVLVLLGMVFYVKLPKTAGAQASGYGGG